MFKKFKKGRLRKTDVRKREDGGKWDENDIDIGRRRRVERGTRKMGIEDRGGGRKNGVRKMGIEDRGGGLKVGREIWV